MKQFQIMRYLKQMRFLIVVVVFLGCLGIYYYTSVNQRYTAEVIIQYTNEDAKLGLAPDGSKIDTKDIYSASVITDVKEDLNLSVNIDQIRSACSVVPIMTDDLERRKTAVLDDGEEFDEVSTIYSVRFRANSDGSKAYVRNVLDSIMNNYYTFYSQKYIDSTLIPNNSLNISVEKYDYLNCIEILDSSIEEIDEYLFFKANRLPDFRSSRTGYSFNDLRNQYRFIRSNRLSEYYAIVLGQKLTRDHDELIRAYENRRDMDEITITNLNDHIEKQRTIIDQFDDKVTRSDDRVAGAIGDNTDAIIQNVEDHLNEGLLVDTTYDKQIDYYVSLQSERNYAQNDRDYCNEILETFRNAPAHDSIDTPTTRALVEDMNQTIAELNELYTILVETADEMSDYDAAQNVKALTGVYAEEEINVPLYLGLALVFFLVVGCLGAVVIGRFVDLWEYFIYIDKKVGIANRLRCDMVIDDYARKLLPDSFTCIVFRLNNLAAINAKGGHNAGNSYLKRFGKFLEDSARDYGFIGYNDSNMFLAFFEDCSKERADNYITSFYQSIADDPAEIKFDVSYGLAESTADHTYEVRSLLKMAISRLFKRA